MAEHIRLGCEHAAVQASLAKPAPHGPLQWMQDIQRQLAGLPDDDAASPHTTSLAAETPSDGFDCPHCALVMKSWEDLQLHVLTDHNALTTPDKPQAVATTEYAPPSTGSAAMAVEDGEDVDACDYVYRQVHRP